MAMPSTSKTTAIKPVAPVEYEIESGVDSNLPFTMPYNPVDDGTRRSQGEEGLQKTSRQGLFGDQGPTVRQLVSMRKQDGQARALYRLLTLPIRSALSSVTFVPAEGGEAEATFIDLVFNTPAEAGGMTVTLQRFMGQMLQSLFDGFSAFEKVFWIPPEGPLKGKVTLKKLAYRPADTVTFLTDQNGTFRGLRQRSVMSGKTIDTFIPKDYAFYYAAQEEERKFYGVSFFQSAFYHYDKKVKLYYTAHLAAQRAAVGTRVGYVPLNASPSSRRSFSAMLANMSTAQWMTVPEGFKVDILHEAGSFDFLNLINHHNSQMSKSVLANFFDSAQGGGSNDTSLVNFAQPGDEMFVLMLRALMDDVANQINHYIIPQIIDFNFKGGKYPKFVWGKLTDEQRSAISATFDKIVAAGQQVTLPKEFVRALEEQQATEMGLEIDWEAVTAREKTEADAATAAQAAQSGPPAGAPAAGAPADGSAPAGGLPGAPSDGSTPPADGVPPVDGGTPITAEMLGLIGDNWTIEEFDAAMKKYTEDQKKKQDSGGAVTLSAQDGLLTLARQMLDLAAEDDNVSA